MDQDNKDNNTEIITMRSYVQMKNALYGISNRDAWNSWKKNISEFEDN